MVKKLLSAMALGCIALCANAQEIEEKLAIKGLYQVQGVIPASFTHDENIDEFWSAFYKDLNYSQTVLTEVSIYDKNLNLKKSLYSPSGIIPMSYQDATSNITYIPATQNLFDSDNLYEYIVPTAFNEGKDIKSLAIIQEDGTVLTTFSFENEKMYLHWMGDNETNVKVFRIFDDYLLREYYYLSINLHSDSESADEYNVTRIYSFEKGKISTSIKKVRDIPHVKVSPTLPQKNEAIKVDLSDMKSPSKVSIVDTNGKVCFTQTIQASQTNVELSTSGMPAGMYIIRVTDGNKEVDNCRVIIR